VNKRAGEGRPDMGYGMMVMEYDWDNPDTWADTDAVWTAIEQEAEWGEYRAEMAGIDDEDYDIEE
jgi:hypothetical protein